MQLSCLLTAVYHIYSKDKVDVDSLGYWRLKPVYMDHKRPLIDASVG